MNNKKIKIIVDATCRIKNAHKKGRAGRGYSACGFVILDENDNILLEGSKYLGEQTVPQAEMLGLIEALEKAPSVARANVEVWMDSELVIKWMNGDYRMKKPEIRALYDEVKKKEQRFIGEVKYFWHNRNAKWAVYADKLANQEYSKHHSGR